MLPLLNIFLITSVDPIKNFVSLKTYISQNASIYYGTTYYIYVDGVIAKDKDNLLEKDKNDFDTVLKNKNIVVKIIGGYCFFIEEEKP